ncbi:unnamed protein product [Brassicogethes aeneus]|uniref:Uncharacterized protein n=1 Tax=Brassicogethes aeneus TaxID=1431903 RepID=A0A9P0FS19_BRAAE|nr:unnamed protein product [Brassicogethes aeneus]
MATFYANPNEEGEPWIERAAIEGYGFRIWHLIFFCFSGVTIFSLSIIQEDYKTEKENINCEMCSPADYQINVENNLEYSRAEPQQPTNFAKKIANAMRMTSNRPMSYK